MLLACYILIKLSMRFILRKFGLSHLILLSILILFFWLRDFLVTLSLHLIFSIHIKCNASLVIKLPRKIGVFLGRLFSFLFLLIV